MIENLPDKLKTLRTKYGLSQKQVAERIDISTSIVSAYETGERTPSTEILLALSNLYNCSTDYLLGKTTAEPDVIFNTNGLTDEQIQAIGNLINVFKKK